MAHLPRLRLLAASSFQLPTKSSMGQGRGKATANGGVQWLLSQVLPSTRPAVDTTASIRVQVPEERCLPEPPLLRLESEASRAYLSALLDLRAGAPEQDGRVPGIETRLTDLCVANLQRFRQMKPAGGDSPADVTATATDSGHP